MQNRLPSTRERSRLFLFAEAVLRPLLFPLLIGTLIESVIAVSVTCGWLSVSDPLYAILFAAGNAAFYYLPLLLADSLAQTIGSSRWVALLVGAILLHPSLTAWLAKRGTVYPGTVLPMLVAVPLLGWIEKHSHHFLPARLQKLLWPPIAIAAVLSVILCIVDPICTYGENLFASGILLLQDYADWAAATVLSFVTPVTLLFSEPHLPASAEDPHLWLLARFSAGGALFGTLIACLMCLRGRHAHPGAAGAGIGTLFGLPREAAFGILLFGKRALLCASVASATGGLYGRIIGLYFDVDRGAPSLFSLVAASLGIHPSGDAPLSAGVIRRAILLFLLTASVGCLLTALRIPHRPKVAPVVTSPRPTLANASLTVYSPMSGRVIPLTAMADPAFSAGVMGQGCAILPTFGKVYAPSDGVVTSVAAAGNGLTFECEDGIQLLLQIGSDRGTPPNDCFAPCCRAGDRVRKGDLLLSFDPDALRRSGIDPTSPLLIVNAERYGELSLTCEGRVTAGDRLLTLTAGE